MYNIFETPDCNICFTPLDEEGPPLCNRKHDEFMQTLMGHSS